CWFKENLNIGTRVNSTEEQTNNSLIEKYCYNNLDANCAIYGGLYQWNEMKQYTVTAGGQGICPSGWHMPTDGEWTTVTTFLGGTSVAGGKMKATGTVQAGTGLWNNPNTGATNESGFSAVPGGYRINNGTWFGIDNYGYWWSSSENNASDGWARGMYYDLSNINGYGSLKYYGFSARCVKDDCPTAPSTPNTGTLTPSQTQIIWNWNTVAGATGYKWSITNDYTAATDMGSLTTKTETGLTCNTPYVRFVWGYNACGNSAALTMNQSTADCPVSTCGTSTLTINHLASGGVAPIDKTT
ncbi:MAG: fibrobacter succinogenes major paralogous domain-containing protein, partial [Bacteroidetes bacterium]|nr:fibrobacter succinogenes major paralogous domain-containing protein [Bacteroidota bacterium]